MDDHTVLVHNTLVDLEETILAAHKRLVEAEAKQLEQQQTMLVTFDVEFDKLITQQKKGNK